VRGVPGKKLTLERLNLASDAGGNREALLERPKITPGIPTWKRRRGGHEATKRRYQAQISGEKQKTSKLCVKKTFGFEIVLRVGGGKKI